MKESHRSALAPPRNHIVSKKHKPPPSNPPQIHHESQADDTPKHRQCPHCYGTKRGVGRPKWWRRVSGTLVKRCYKCDQCGMDWTADVRTYSEVLKIEHHEISVQYGQVDLEER